MDMMDAVIKMVKKERYVVIEQAEDGEAYITHIQAKNIDEALEEYNKVRGGNLIILTEQAYYRMCQSGAGA